MMSFRLFKTAMLCFLAAYFSPSLEAQGFKVSLQVKTANKNHAGTNDPIYFAIHYTELVEIPRKNPKASPIKRKVLSKKIVALDNPGNDRITGAIENYELEFSFSPDTITAIEIGSKKGDDAWLVEGIKYQLKRGDLETKVKSVPVMRWVSGAANDGSKKNPAKMFYVFKIARPKFKKPVQAVGSGKKVPAAQRVGQPNQ